MAEQFDHVVVVPDSQYPYHHRPAEAAVMEFVRKTKPWRVIHLGDFMDFESVSRFLREGPPRKRWTLAGEIEYGQKKAREWVALSPKSEWWMIPGNHDIRPRKYVAQHAEQLLGIRGMGFDEMLELPEAGWKVLGDYGDGMWVGRKGGLWATHGDYVRKWSGATARAHVIEKYGHSVVHGHTHRLGSFFHTDAQGMVAGFEAGTLCDMRKTPPHHRVSDWQHGFASVWVSRTSKRFQCDLVPINHGSFLYGGKRYGR